MNTANERETKVRQTLAEVLAVPLDQVTLETTAESLPAWDSVLHLNLVLALEEVFATTFSPEEIMAMSGLRQICEVIEAKVG